jgi:hypothetical protein
MRAGNRVLMAAKDRPEFSYLLWETAKMDAMPVSLNAKN